MKVYILNGDPIPLARPRFTQRKSEPLVYDPQQQLKLVSKINLAQQHADAQPYTGPLILHATFYFKIPVNKKYPPLSPHIYKPDLSNIVKYIEDVAQNVGIIKDDCSIVQLIAQKLYDKNPRTEFYFEEYHGKKSS